VTINEFIKKRPHLVWYTQNYDRLSKESIVEAVLNYGDWDDVQKLFSILGIKRAAEIFRKKSRKSKMGRCNYDPKIINYFNLYFQKYAR
jgi:hypothetical protein